MNKGNLKNALIHRFSIDLDLFVILIDASIPSGPVSLRGRLKGCVFIECQNLSGAITARWGLGSLSV